MYFDRKQVVSSFQKGSRECHRLKSCVFNSPIGERGIADGTRVHSKPAYLDSIQVEDGAVIDDGRRIERHNLRWFATKGKVGPKVVCSSSQFQQRAFLFRQCRGFMVKKRLARCPG